MRCLVPMRMPTQGAASSAAAGRGSGTGSRRHPDSTHQEEPGHPQRPADVPLGAGAHGCPAPQTRAGGRRVLSPGGRRGASRRALQLRRRRGHRVRPPPPPRPATGPEVAPPGGRRTSGAGAAHSCGAHLRGAQVREAEGWGLWVRSRPPPQGPTSPARLELPPLELRGKENLAQPYRIRDMTPRPHVMPFRCLPLAP